MIAAHSGNRTAVNDGSAAVAADVVFFVAAADARAEIGAVSLNGTTVDRDIAAVAPVAAANTCAVGACCYSVSYDSTTVNIDRTAVVRLVIRSDCRVVVYIDDRCQFA